MRRLITLTAALLLMAPAAWPTTSTSGSLRVVVRDSTAAILPGVTVELRGPDAPARVAVSEAAGEVRFPFLTPGRGYELVATLDGFESVRRTDVQILLGRESTLTLELRPSVARELTVVAERPLINVRDTSTSTNITAEQFERLPTRRDFQYLTVIAPGVLLDGEFDKLSPRVGGATHLENDYIIEGVSTRDPRTGASAAKVTMDFVSDVQVMTGEYPAEYGRATGGIFNVVTRSGTNRYQGSLLTYYEDSDWASETPKRTIRGTTTYDLGRDRGDVGASVGGPIVRDRAWFFLSYDYRRNVAPLHLYDPAYGIDRNEEIETGEDVYGGKVTAALTGSQSLTLTGFGNPTTTSGWVGEYPYDAPDVALVTRKSGSTNATLRYEAIFGAARLLELSVGRHHQALGEIGMTEIGRIVPLQSDYTGQFIFNYGGTGWSGGQEAKREAFAMRGSFARGRHELRAGVDYEMNRYDDRSMWSQYALWGQDDLGSDIGIADVMVHSDTDYEGFGTNDITTVFAQNQWQVSPSVNVNLGLRWERQELSSGRGAVLAVGRTSAGRIIREEAGSVTLDDNWAPRIGIAWDPSGIGRAKLYAAAGRFFEAIPVAINVNHMNGYSWVEETYYSPTRHTAANWVNPSGSPVDDDWTLLGSERYYLSGSGQLNGGPTPIDPDMELQYQDEMSVGGEIQLGRSWVAGARYINRQIGNVIEDHHVVDAAGKRVDYIVSNIGSGAYASEFPEPERKFQSVELTLQRRMTDRWQLAGSFVRAEEEGDYNGLYSNATNFDGGGSPNSTFDVEMPEWQRNAYGKLRGDVPWQFKAHGSYSFPFGLTVSEGLIYSAGVPISGMLMGYPLGGVRVVHLVPRGSQGRTPDWYQLDLHVDYRFPITSSGVDLAVIVDAFNVTDEDEALYVDEAMVYRNMPGWSQWIAPGNRDEYGIPKYSPDLPVSPYYKMPRAYQPPRSFQAGLKITF